MVRMRLSVLILMLLSALLLFAVTVHAEHGDIVESAGLESTSEADTE